MKIAIIGAGAWGTALATLVRENGHDVMLWAYESDVVDAINEEHENKRYLPGVQLERGIRATNDLKKAICGAQWVFEAVPVQFLRTVLSQAITCFDPEQTWVVTSKGIEQETLLLPSQMIDELCAFQVKKAVIAGPSFASDLARKQPTGIAVAADDCAIASALQTVLANAYFRPYVSLDMIGVQMGGAVKNVIALGVGMLEGAGFSDNAKALLFTRGLHEMVQLGIAMGGMQETFYGLSGVGDTAMTAMGGKSRNLEVGKRLGRGQKLLAILDETGFVPEGVNTVQSLQRLMIEKKIDAPICRGVYQVICDGLPIQALLDGVLDQPLRFEQAYNQK